MFIKIIPCGSLRIVSLAAFWILPALAALAGCNWKDFDELAEDAPVQVVGTPDGLDSFGPAAVALRRSDEAESYQQNTVVVAGGWSKALVKLKVSTSGKISRSSGGAAVGAEENTETRSMVQIAARQGDAAVLVGSPSAGIIFPVRLPLSGNPIAEEGISRAAEYEHFGGAVAAGELGDVGGVNDPEEWMAVSDRSLYIFYGPMKGIGNMVTCSIPPPCVDTTTCPEYRAEHRSLAVGTFFTQDHNQQKMSLAVGAPAPGAGRVYLIRFVNGTLPDPGGMCPDGFVTHVIEAPNEGGQISQLFGTRILPLRLNGDYDSLLVAAPDRGRIYLYSNPTGDASDLLGEPDQVITPEDQENAVRFGESMALVNVDGEGAPELVVGDPEASVKGKRGAGRVHIFSLDTTAGRVGSELGVVYDFEPESVGGLGLAVAPLIVGESSSDQEELVVVGYEGVYIFFLTGVSGDADPR